MCSSRTDSRADRWRGMMKLVPDIRLARLKSGLFWRTFFLLGA
jgi:hypothetical protein